MMLVSLFASRCAVRKRLGARALGTSVAMAALTMAVSSAFGDAATPVIDSLSGGIQVSNLHYTTGFTLSAFPLQSPPVNGFSALVAVTLTDDQGSDREFYSIKQTSLSGNRLANGYTYLAILDSGAQSHIVSATDAEAIDFENEGLDGDNVVSIQGANGTEDLTASDVLGVFVTGAQNLNTVSPALHAPDATYKGQIRTSVLYADPTLDPPSQIPSIIGEPIFGQYGVNIRNSQTKRIALPDGTAVCTPSVELVNHGSTQVYKYRMSVSVQDGIGASQTDPAFIPSIENFQNFGDNPSTPSFWSFPIANVKVTHTAGTLTQQPFLFDTGAQVTVLSEEEADDLGIDVDVDPPQFTLDVLGVGGTGKAKGYFIQKLELSVAGGTAIFTDVPVVVANVTDPRSGSGYIPGIIGMSLFTDRDLSIDLGHGAGTIYFSDPYTAQWNLAARGNWLPDNNWVLGVPDGADVPANFLGTITSASTINVDGNYTVGSMTFDNVNSYTLAGAGRITFETLGRPSTIHTVHGSHTISAPMTLGETTAIVTDAGTQLTLSGDTSTPTASVTKSGAGTLRLSKARYASFSVSAGTAQILAGGGNSSTSKVSSYAVASGATLDLTDSKFIVDYTGTSPLSTIAADVAAGRISSSLLNAARGIGFGEASALHLTTFGGLAVDGSAVVFRMTLKGDADLNGTVDFNDLLALAKGYNGLNTTWTSGDFDYNGTTNFNDMLLMAKNYNGVLPGSAGLDSSIAADWALASSLVPEPALLGLIISLGVFSGRRR